MAQTVYMLQQYHDGDYGEGTDTHVVGVYATLELARTISRRMFLDAMKDEDDRMWRWYELEELLDLLAAFDAGKDENFLPNFHVVSLDVITD